MVHLVGRLLRSGKGIIYELKGGLRLVADVPSFLRYASDVFLYRILRVVDLPSQGSERWADWSLSRPLRPLRPWLTGPSLAPSAPSRGTWGDASPQTPAIHEVCGWAPFERA